MPELPDVVGYIEALRQRVFGHNLDRIRLGSPFLPRTASPSIAEVEGKTVTDVRRIGKRIGIGFDGELWLVLHLMIAGRLHWREPGVKLPAKRALAAFDFSAGSLLLTEAGSQKRASLHVVRGEDGIRALDPGGLEVLTADVEAFAAALRSENHTVKRALTDPRLFSGIGNAYSDEILHRARLSPVSLTRKLTVEDIRRLFEATIQVLDEWVARLRSESRNGFPERVTAFRKEMAVHGKYGQPCPRCGTKVQRIRYAANETNYCPRCQTAGKLLADRALSRLLREDWPRTLEELEALRRPPVAAPRS